MIGRVAPVMIIVALASSTARAADPEDCFSVAERGQRQRTEGHYLEAKRLLTSCAASTCPAMVRQDCAGWLAELDRSIPSVVFAVRTEGEQDVAGAAMTLDGKPLAWSPGRPVVLDPGEHVVAASAPGFLDMNQRVVVNAGEKNRLVLLRLARESTEKPARPMVPNEAIRPIDQSTPVPTVSWVLGGVGVVSLGVSLFLGLSARSDLNDLEQAPCAATKSCGEAERTSAKTRLVLADVTLIAGAAAIATGIGLWLTAPKRVQAGLTSSGVTVRGAF